MQTTMMSLTTREAALLPHRRMTRYRSGEGAVPAGLRVHQESDQEKLTRLFGYEQPETLRRLFGKEDLERALREIQRVDEAAFASSLEGLARARRRTRRLDILAKIRADYGDEARPVRRGGIAGKPPESVTAPGPDEGDEASSDRSRNLSCEFEESSTAAMESFWDLGVIAEACERNGVTLGTMVDMLVEMMQENETPSIRLRAMRQLRRLVRTVLGG